MGFLKRLFGDKTGGSEPSEAEFAQMIIERVRGTGETRELAYDPERSLITVAGGGVASLGNLYAEFRSADPERRELVLENTARLLLIQEEELPSSFDEARASLRPVVRSRFQEEASRLQMEAAGTGAELKHWPSEPLGDHMVLGVAYDFPEGIHFVNQDQLGDWGVSFEEALEAARRNLAEVEVEVGAVGGSLYIPMAGDSYDGGRLTMLEMVRGFELQGDPVALVLNRDTLMIAGSDDEEGLRMMADYTRQHLEDARPVCWIPVRLDGDTWRSWLPPKGHPAYGDFRMLQIQHLGSEYAEQQNLLNDVHQRQGVDLFVASYSVIKTDDDELISYSVWPNGIPTWLPRVDQLALAESAGAKPLLVPWDVAVQRLGHLMERVEVYPERFKVEGFPSSEDLEYLRGVQ